MEIFKILFTPTAITFIGALIAATGVFWSALEDSKIKLELQEKTEKIAELNQEITKTVIGGDSYAYIQPFIDTKNNKITLNLNTEGGYPMYDLKINITDKNQVRTLSDAAAKNGKEWTRYDYDKNVIQVNIGNIAPGQIVPNLYIVDLGGGGVKTLDYTIRISARNGNFFQPLKINITDKGLDVDSKVHKGEQILKEL